MTTQTPELLALIAAAACFREYEQMHLAKTPPDYAKAERNSRMATTCEMAIHQATRAPTPTGVDREARAQALYNAMKEEGSPMGGFTRWADWAEIKDNASGECYYRGADALAPLPSTGEVESLEGLTLAETNAECLRLHKESVDHFEAKVSAEAQVTALQGEGERLTRDRDHWAALCGQQHNVRQAAESRLTEAVGLLREMFDAADGLSHGTDWNSGTHAKTHGYRAKLLAAVPKTRAFLASIDGETK